MVSCEIRARGEVPAVVRRPGTGGQGNDSECKHSSPFPCPLACALEEPRPRHSSLFSGWTVPPFPKRRGERRNRRAPGASAGGKQGDDGRSRPELTGFPPAVGDLMIADISAVGSRHCRITSAKLSAFICVICGLLRWVAFVPSCLRVCDVGGWAPPRPLELTAAIYSRQ